MSSNTAILFFSRTARNEAHFKRIDKSISFVKNLKIIHQMKVATMKKIHLSGLHCIEIDEKLQEGFSFGERLYNALKSCFHAGYENIIIIGNDCPDLQSDNLVQSAQILQKQDFVLGPDLNNGLYLIGISRQIFNKIDFQKLPWHKKCLATFLEKILHENDFKGTILDAKSDLNERIQVFQVKNFSFLAFINLILSEIFEKLILPLFSVKYFKQSHSIVALELRGPPRS